MRTPRTTSLVAGPFSAASLAKSVRRVDLLKCFAAMDIRLGHTQGSLRLLRVAWSGCQDAGWMSLALISSSRDRPLLPCSVSSEPLPRRPSIWTTGPPRPKS
jgi:hypothetical protein